MTVLNVGVLGCLSNILQWLLLNHPDGIVFKMAL
jgi:hypothetical protein